MVERENPAIDSVGEAMPAGRILGYEPDGPLGTVISRGSFCFCGGCPPREKCDGYTANRSS